jgi:hypothetical protein
MLFPNVTVSWTIKDEMLFILYILLRMTQPFLPFSAYPTSCVNKYTMTATSESAKQPRIFCTMEHAGIRARNCKG